MGQPISDPIYFLNRSIDRVENITFTPEQFMVHVNAVNYANWQALVYGLAIGFIIGVACLYLGIWWNGRQG